MEFASKYVLDASEEEESINEDDVFYSDSEGEDDIGDNSSEDEAMTPAAAPPQPPPPPALPSRKKLSKKVAKATVNVVSVPMSKLGDPATLMTGDPIFCKCGAAFSAISKLQAIDDQSVWVCEFCDNHNPVAVAKEEIPTSEILDYLVEVPAATTTSSTGGIVIFCIDISGSMCQTTEVDGKHKLKGGALERLREYQRFNNDFSDQYMPNERRDITYVSRLQCVQGAISTQLEAATGKTGLITFNNEVTVIGDALKPSVVIAGDHLYDREYLIKAGEELVLERSINESRAALTSKLFELEETGATALGPALLVSIAAAGKIPGSKVIICTDGQANVGLGALDGSLDSTPFYTSLAEYASGKGVMVSVITIAGTNCRLEKLGAVADVTNGQVNVVDPLSLTQEFATIMQDEVLATDVSATFLVHKNLQLRNQVGDLVPESVIERKVGVATASSEVTFQYCTREHAMLGSQLPFQAQIRYTKLDGCRYVRVVTNVKEVTKERNLAEATAQAAILGNHYGQQAAHMAMDGRYGESRAQAFANKVMLKKLVANSANRDEQTSTYKAWKKQAAGVSKALAEAKKKEREQGLYGSDDEDADDWDAVEAEHHHAKIDEKHKALKAKESRSDQREDVLSNALYRMKHGWSKKK